MAGVSGESTRLNRTILGRLFDDKQLHRSHDGLLRGSFRRVCWSCHPVPWKLAGHWGDPPEGLGRPAHDEFIDRLHCRSGVHLVKSRTSECVSTHGLVLLRKVA